MSSRRRNGKSASCEPCRKDKVRCDHSIPVCARCLQRKIASRCFYHPAPLTRKEDSLSSRGNVQRNGRLTRRSFQMPTRPSIEITVRAPISDQSISTGYLGPTSFVADFTRNPEMASPSNSSPLPLGEEDMPSILPPYWIQEITKVLGLLSDFPTVEQLVHEFYDVSQAAVIPAPLVLGMVAGIKASTGKTLSKAAKVLRNTAQVFKVPSGIDGNSFRELFTDEYLRLEAIGILYALAGRASCFGFAHERFPGNESSTLRPNYAREMLAASDTILQVCKILTPTNDLMMWLQCENLLLTSMTHGDTNSVTWHRLGELSSNMLELGLHRDSQKPDLPLFLRESRRRIFAAIYSFDKVIATFLGRPPRISFRHSDCQPPLDLSDDVLVASPQQFISTFNTLDTENWCKQRVFHRSSWMRVRFLVGTFREEILELSLKPLCLQTTKQLLDVLHRSRRAWDAIPEHLCYSSTTWDDSLPIGVRLMLIVSYIAHLYNQFLIHRLLVQQDPSTEPELLDVSSSILSTVLVMGRQREHMVDIQRDFVCAAVLYGFPSASILTKALQKETQTGHRIPHNGSRSTLIRNLSVFISHLESMSRSYDAERTLFDRASRIFANVIDEILESRLAVAPSATAPTADTLGEVNTGTTPSEEWNSLWVADGVDFLDTVDFNPVFDQWVF